jgi:predicted Fe-S protein YdhL (DUF1289 family)
VNPNQLLLLKQARRVRCGTGAVPSPCTAVCRIDAATGWCEGCFRTLDEIAAWGRLPDADRRGVWAHIERRASGQETA